MIHVIAVIDESGSMMPQRNETIIGFNEYVKGLQAVEEPMTITVWAFNSTHTHMIRSVVGVKDMPRLTDRDYYPDGWTPLYDALGLVLMEAKFPKDEPVLCVIVTDGEENYSKTWNRDKIAALISELQEEKKWSFAYLGANQDSWVAGGAIGIYQMSTQNYDVGHTPQMWRGMTQQTIHYAAGQTVAMAAGNTYSDGAVLDNYTPLEQDDEIISWKEALKSAKQGNRGRKQTNRKKGDGTNA